MHVLDHVAGQQGELRQLSRVKNCSAKSGTRCLRSLRTRCLAQYACMLRSSTVTNPSCVKPSLDTGSQIDGPQPHAIALQAAHFPKERMDLVLVVVELSVSRNVVAAHHRKDAAIVAVTLHGSVWRIQKLRPVLGLHIRTLCCSSFPCEDILLAIALLVLHTWNLSGKGFLYLSAYSSSTHLSRLLIVSLSTPPRES